MSGHHPALTARARRQWEMLPDLYSPVDPADTPHRFTTDPDAESALPRWIAPREPILRDPSVVELMRTATVLADPPADAYALSADRIGHRQAVEMLRTACRQGLQAVPGAPEELVALIEAMEATPEWIDSSLVEEGARESRVPAAYLTPWIIRGVFLGTFTNTYSALPMALTGALTTARAAHRVRETATFFTVTTMPRAMDRHGPGFEAAAIVRLMHSFVRVAALRDEGWDASVYGMPIPQVDQMPAGMVNLYLLARKVEAVGGSDFNARERAVVEFTRYRCFLLGLPQELLPITPKGVIQVFHARGALLREDFDDATCGRLVRSTIDARLQLGESRWGHLVETLERSWSKVAFCRAFCDGDRARAAAMGVEITTVDRLRVGLTAPFVLGRMTLAVLVSGIPGVRVVADAVTLWVLRRRLRGYGADRG